MLQSVDRREAIDATRVVVWPGRHEQWAQLRPLLVGTLRPRLYPCSPGGDRPTSARAGREDQAA
jgi:hypothetical protein